MSINIDLVARLEKNSKSSFTVGINIYLKLLKNIINNPSDEKYRRFKKTNQRIMNDLLSLDGMEQLLLDSGFEVDNEEFVLRRGGLGVMSKLKYYMEYYEKRLKDSDVDSSVLAKPLGAIQKKTNVKDSKLEITAGTIKSSKTFQDRIKFPQVLNTNNEFLKQIEKLSDSVMQYEDDLLKESALQLIPLETLKLKALEKLRKLQKLLKNNSLKEDEPLLDDLILEELTEWFKNRFFTWINSMPCRLCQNKDTNPIGTRIENGVRIESYKCNKTSCNDVVTDFPRYNDIAKLLVSRSGRCGEFANCFTFLCRCLGFDARYVYSTSDHVWSEVYNHSKKRWIHIDPSENIFDSPLMYEHGWKRNLDYVIAFSRDDIQDVTWRYSNKHQELLKRRNLCSETDLVNALMRLRLKRSENSSVARKKFLTLRTFAELAELLIIREPTENELKGRSSGSQAWRLERGEANISNFYIFTLTDEEKKLKEFNLRYSCSRNVFERFSSAKILNSVDDWKLWTYESENIFRKVEHDHKMSYLSRTEDSSKGILKLKFDFENLSIDSLDLTFETITFENGNIKIEFLNAFDQEVSKNQLKGLSKFSLRIHLSGGKGDCAWQHAQMFRQELTSKSYPFQLSVKFK
ncbi:CLUMA_CG013379, isoform A [Clunio marinus]|uniref:Peptide-N(4)-(N-acetyl-beta-glucosaminyl)asparagine amidase n=1 Tax=Clunio marinus TaxID=568069 RepID=A0A1J1INN8_9DIPT|nr:CLUMA_CG013379, isoform A [Clunio marinus]